MTTPTPAIPAHNLAYAYREVGDLGRAVPLYEQTLADADASQEPITQRRRSCVTTSIEAIRDQQHSDSACTEGNSTRYNPAALMSIAAGRFPFSATPMAMSGGDPIFLRQE